MNLVHTQTDTKLTHIITNNKNSRPTLISFCTSTANISKPQVDNTHDTQDWPHSGPSAPSFQNPLLHSKASVLASNATWPQWLIHVLTAHTSVILCLCLPSFPGSAHSSLPPRSSSHSMWEGYRWPLLAGITCHLPLARWLHAIPHCWHLASAAGSCYLLLLQPSERSHSSLSGVASESMWPYAFIPFDMFCATDNTIIIIIP